MASVRRCGTRRRGCRFAQIAWQCGVVALLLVLSFGRRNGPIRLPVRLPRSSPVGVCGVDGAAVREGRSDSRRRSMVRGAGC